MKLFSIQDSNNWYFSQSFRFQVNSIVKHRKEHYSGGENYEYAEIIGFEIRPANLIKSLNEYTHEEIYKVRYPDGRENVLWPNEAEIIK